jgi:hypothetical protein
LQGCFFVSDHDKQVLILVVIDDIGVGLVDGDDILDVLGYVVDTTSEDHQLHLKSTLLVVLEMQEVLGYALPI